MLPPGYEYHPTDPRYMWSPTTGDMRPAQEIGGAPPATAPAAGHGVLDVKVAQQEYLDQEARKGLFREGGLLYLDFPELTNWPSEVRLLLRFLPPWGPEITQAWVKVARHRLPASVVPDAPSDRQFLYFDCLDSRGGPGNCPLTPALNKIAASSAPDAAGFVKLCSPRQAIYMQAIDLEKPSEHFSQVLDAAGQPQIDPATGQPVWRVQPGILRMGPMLFKSVLNYIIKKGDPTHPDFGYAMSLDKKKTGKEDMDIEYSAMDYGDKGPIDPALRPVLMSLVDLSQRVINFKPAADLQKIADAMLDKFKLRSNGAALHAVPAIPPMSSAGWVPHPTSPGWEWQPSTNQVRPATPPVMVPMPVVAPPPAPAYPQPAPALPAYQPAAWAQPVAPMLPGVPSVMPPRPPTPPAVPSGYPLPPVIAPGGVSVPGVPGMPPPPPPGMPPSMSPIAPPPPPMIPGPGAPPPPPHGAMVMTPEQLEAELMGKDNVPF